MSDRDRTPSADEELLAAAGLPVGEEDDLPPEMTTPAVAEEAAEKVRPRRTAEIAPGRLGFLFTATTLAAAAAGGLMVAVAPAGIVGRLGALFEARDFGALPALLQGELLIPAVAALAVILFAVGGSLAIRRAAAGARRRYREAEALVHAVTKLDPDNEGSWRADRIKAHPALSRFLGEFMGSYRGMKTKLTRFVGLEGELLRLENGLVNNERVDLADSYDHPAAARLADEVLRLFDERAESRSRFEEVSARMGEGKRVCGDLEESVAWNCLALDRLNVQAMNLERHAPGLEELVRTVQQARLRLQSQSERFREIAAVREKLEGLATRSRESGDRAGLVAQIKKTDDRCSKLGFQLALSVAKLGPAASSLLPLTEELKQLTLDFQNLAEALESIAGPDPAQAAILSAALKKLGEMEQGAEQARGSGQTLQEATVRLSEMLPVIGQVVNLLDVLGTGFNEQDERLKRSGEAIARLVGARFDPGARIEETAPEEPAADLQVERFDPFGSRPGGSVESIVPESNGLDLTRVPIPQSGGTEEDELPDRPPVISGGSIFEPELPSTGESVYDRGSFDAVPEEEGEPAEDEDAGRIYDLSEFDAVVIP
jgi:hypothetical protein